MMQRSNKYQQEMEADITWFEVSPGLRIVFLPDDDFTVFGISNDMCRFIQTERSVVVGNGVKEFFLIPFFKDHPHLYEMLLNSLRQVIESRLPVSQGGLEYIHQVKGGNINDFLGRMTTTPVLDSNGEIKFIVITADQWHNEAETRLKKTFSIDTVGVIYFDLDGVIHDANSAFQKMSGFSHEDFLTGKVRWDQLTPPEFIEATLKSRYEFLTKWQNTPYEKQYFRPDGSRWWGLFAGKRLSENECVEFVLDITPLKTVEHELERRVKERTRELELLNMELLRSNNSLEHFAYAASHDLKEPMRKIQIFADRLKKSVEGRLTNQEKLFIERISSSVFRMNSLVEDLLSYSHLNFVPNTFEEVDLNEVLHAVLGDLDLEIEERRATIDSTSLPKLKGHKRQLQQVFQNLLSNALKYQRDSIPPVVNITCDIVDGDEIKERTVPLNIKYYVISIQDNGIGFEQQYAEQIFNVFTRLHGSNEYNGTGIGLSIVRKIIEIHGGFVTATGFPWKGAIFSIYLPIN